MLNTRVISLLDGEELNTIPEMMEELENLNRLKSLSLSMSYVTMISHLFAPEKVSLVSEEDVCVHIDTSVLPYTEYLPVENSSLLRD